jgi:hypothetical protein
MISARAPKRKEKLAGNTTIFLRIGILCVSSLTFVLGLKMPQVSSAGQ